jgi:hypothetical protein
MAQDLSLENRKWIETIYARDFDAFVYPQFSQEEEEAEEEAEDEEDDKRRRRHATLQEELYLTACLVLNPRKNMPD